MLLTEESYEQPISKVYRQYTDERRQHETIISSPSYKLYAKEVNV